MVRKKYSYDLSISLSPSPSLLIFVLRIFTEDDQFLYIHILEFIHT